jgi:protein-S-isoprenylcysteine O-methyltransferase Ste14
MNFAYRLIFTICLFFGVVGAVLTAISRHPVPWYAQLGADVLVVIPAACSLWLWTPEDVRHPDAVPRGQRRNSSGGDA